VLASAGALTPAPAKPAPSWSLRSRLAGVPGWLCVARGPGPDRTSGLLPLPVASVARKRLRREMVIAAPLRRAMGGNARGLIRLRLFQSTDVGGSTRVSKAWRGGSRLSKPPWKDFRTQSTVGPGPRRRDRRAGKKTALSQMARALSDDVRWRGI
jgi:hypothetical protein